MNDATVSVSIPMPTGPAESAKMSDVRQKVEALGKRISYLEEVSSALVGRLMPVLPEVKAVDGKKENPAETYRCPLSHDLRDFGNRLDVVAGLLREALADMQI